MAMTYDEFQRRRKAGETVQDLTNETNASKPPETYSVPYGTLTYDEFKNARQAGVKLDDLVEVGKTKPAPSVYQTRASDYAQRVMDTEAENNWGKPDTRTTLQKATDKLLGVDRTKVTGGKTDWGKLAEGAAVKGANQANAGFWSGVGIFNDIGKKITNSKVGNWLFGDLADGANAIATTTINGAIDTINSIFGTNYAGIKNGQSALDFLVSDAQAGKANAQTKYEANANTSRAAQIIDQFGTATVAAIPMAIEAAVLAPTQAAQAAQVTTSGLSYFSGLQNAKGVEAVGMMGREGLNKLFRNPQFWTSYLQAAGDGYESAKEDGMNQDDAAVYALTNGFFNAMVEVGGADEALGGIQNLPMRLRQAAESGNKSAVVNWFKDSVLGEAWEEVQQGALERGIKSFFGQDAPIFSVDPTDDRAIINPYTAGQEFLGGAVVGGLLGGGQIAANSAVQSVSDSRTFMGDAQALIKAAKNSAQEADQASIAQIESAVAARKGNTMTMGEARTLQEIASRTGNMHAYVQNIMQAENQQRADQQREATQKSRVSRYLERVRAGEVDQTGTADTKGATIQYEGKQAKVDFVRDGDQNRVRLTFDDGTERTVSYQEAADAGLDENVQNLMVALSAIGPNAPAAYSVYESDQEVGRYAAAMDEAINLYAAQGQDVRKAAAAARESNSPAMITYLTDAQLELAQSLGSKIYEQKQTQVKEAGAKLAEIRQAAQQAMSAQNVTATEGLAAVNATLTDARQHLKNVGAAFNDTMEYLDEMAANGQEGTEAYQNALEQANALRDDLYGTQKVIEALAEERKNLQAQQPIKRKQGTVSFAGGTINGEKVNGVDRSKLNRQQKNVVAMVEALADAVNVDYVFFDGNAKGNQGAYVQGGTVYINVNAGMAANKALAAATLSHELTHYMQEFAPEEHEQLKQFIISNVLQKGELDRLVQQQLRLEPNLSYDQALDEVVANACQTMLQDSKAIAKLARQNMTLAEKIADYIEDITARLKAAFEDVNYQDNLPLYNAVKAMEDQLDEMQRLWDAGIEAATGNYNAVQQTRGQTETTEETMPAAAQRADTQTLNEQAEQAGISIDEETESAYPNAVQFSRQSWEESEYYQKRDEAAIALSKALGVSKRKALSYIDSINGVAKAIANDQQRLDYEASEGVSALIGNTEYGGSIDFSTICKKRRLMTGTFTAIQRALPNTALTAEEILTIRRMMDDKGDEVSCGLCYVEGSRAKMGIYAKQFLERYAKTNPDYLPNMAEINTPEGIEQIRRQHPEIYDAYVKFMNGLAQRKPKLYQMATEYAGEVLNKFLGKKNQVDKYNHNGGLRLQSFSDFEIIHLIDNMQVILDMARVGLNGQAYTKVPEFAWAMGNTGLKINLSLIAKGVDESGHIILDEKEGMKRADAEALRNAYSDNVGTILVIFNDEQLRAAMADDFIDFIIPFHRSQWNSQQYALMGLPKRAKDYTMQQNESYIEPVLNSNGKPTRPANYMPNNYWDYSKTGKENAENYLRMCAENNRKPKFSNLLVDNGDGSYSLQPDGSTDGYWKLLIDFKMYDNDGNGVPQRPVQPIFNEGSENDPHTVLGMLKAYKGGHQTFPVDQEIVDRFVSQYKAAHPDQTQFQAWDSMTKEEQDREIQKNIAFNESQTQTGSPLKTLKGSDINRGGTLRRIRYPIGKVIAERLYIHKDYVDSAIAVNPAFGTALEKAENALRAAYPDFEYNCVNYHPKSGEIQFQEAPDFDTGREPVVGHQVNVAADGTVSPIKSFGQIWHHKWQWVGNDYNGFDVRESWEWSKEWLSTILGASKGGSIKAWNGQLAEYGLPADTGVRNQQWDNEESAPVSQEFNSKDTSINIDKLPSVFSNNWFKRELHPGGVNIDIGGGKYDNAAEYLKQFGVTNMVFDPYNRTEEHNQGVLDYIMDGNRADTVTCANVLNVIKEAGARENVILECAKAMKPDGKAYFLIYEGDKSTNGRITKTPVRDRNGKIQKDENGKTIYSTSWQEHRDAKSYIDEIKKYFNTVKPHSNLIVAEDPKADLPRAAWETTEGKATRYQMWDSGEETRRNLHPEIRKALDDAAALEERVREFFSIVPEDSEFYLSEEQIEELMEVNVYGSDGDIQSAEDIIDNISNLAKNMRGSDRETAYELMDDLLKHLSVAQQDRWIEMPRAHDHAFAEWYSRKHPSLYYPGYVMGKLDLDKEVNYLREIIGSGILTPEDEAYAERLYEAMTSSYNATFYQKWDDTGDDTASEDAGRRMAYAMIQAENNALKDAIAGLNKLTNKQNTTIAKLEQKLRLTKTPEVRQSDANRLARQLVKDHSSTADAARIAAELKALGDYILQNKKIDADVVKQRARAIAAEIVQNAETTVDYGGELAMYRNITSDIKGKKLTIDEDFLGELDAVDGYDAFRKRNFANFTLAKRETGDSAGREGYSTVGSYYSTLQQQYGEAYFPEVANEGEQIQVIADMFQRAKGITVNPNEDYMGEATEELANRIAFDVMGGIMRPTPPTQADRQKARTDALRQQIKDLQKEGALSEKEADMLRKTIYDLTLALDNAESRYKTLQVTSDERFRQMQAEGKERAVEAKLRERARQEEKIAALKDHYQEMADRARDRRENTHTRHKIRKLVDRLNKMLKSPTEKRHIPRELVKETIAVLEMIDLDTGRSENITAQLAKIRQMYEGYKNNPTYAVGYDETVDEMLSNLQQTIGETPLHKMTAEQLEAVYSTLRALNHVISTAVQVQIGEQERNAFELAESMTAETRDIPKAQKGWLRSHYLPAHLRADVMFNRLGGHKKNSVWSQIARMLNDGQLKQTMITMQLSTPFASLVNDERALQDFTGTDKRGRIDQKKLVDIGLKDKDGNTIKVTHGIMVGIYMDLLNEQNRRHLIRGGKTIPNLNDYYSGKGGFGTGTVRAVGIATELSDLYHQMNEAKEDGDTDLVQELEDRIEEVQLSGETYADTMQKSIESQMTAFDRKWVAAIQQLMDVDSKAFLNATTMEVYGIEKASVDNYYPITSDPDFLSTPFESITKDMNLENVGFMKERVLNASNPTLAMDVSDVVNNQINRVAQYCGLMPAIRNFNKVYNKTEGGYNDSLKSAINDVFGKEGKKYIENLMADLTGSRRSSEDSLGLSRILGGLRGNLAQTTLTLNPRVALAQAASYPTAAAELGWGPLVKAFAHGGKNGRMISRADAQLIAEYSPLLWYRMQGYSQQELADASNRNDYVGRLWKKMRWATGWIQAVDGATVGRLWYAAEYWVDANKPELKKGTDAYYQEVAKKFNDVVEKTQPNYTTMQRADVLRSPSDLVKTLTMFMTQRLQNFNIIYDSTAGYQKARADFVSGRNGVTATDVKEAKTQMVQAVTSQLAQAAVFTAFKMFADALLHNMNGYRDDETGDLTPESVALQLLRNYIDALVGAAIFGSEIYSLIKVFTAGDSWYGLSVNGVDSVNDLVDDTVNLMKTDVDTSTEKGRAKLGNNILKAAQSWAQLLGAPLRNAIKMVSSVRYHIEDIKNGEFLSFEAGYERTKKQIAFKENIQPVGISGKQYEKILKQMNTDKSGSVSQAEAYTYLSEEYAKGKLSKEQVEGIWNAQGWSKAYDEYAETAEKAAAKEAEQNRNLEAAGVTPEQYEAMKAEMNTDGNSSVTQEEAGKYLQDQVNTGNLTEAQADALWKVVGPTWKKTYGQWQGNDTEPTTTQTVRPAPTPESVKITTYDQFKSAAHIYSDKRETAYNLWESSVQPLGIDLDRYTQYINVSDVNDNGSVTQEELGATLTEAINRGELNGDQAEAIWHTLWNGGRSKTYASWAAKNATRGGMPSQEELLELNENPDRYDVGDTTVTAAEILAETLDRGQTITRVGETYQLIPGEYPSRKQYGEWLPVLEELGIDPGDVWENGQHVTLSQMSQYYTPEEFRDEIEYRRKNKWWIDLGFEEEPAYAANELYLGWQENPDYPGQTFEEYLNTPESQSWMQQLAQLQSESAGGEWDRLTGAAPRTYRGTGQKARRSGEALYISRAMRDSKRGRR